MYHGYFQHEGGKNQYGLSVTVYDKLLTDMAMKKDCQRWFFNATCKLIRKTADEM